MSESSQNGAARVKLILEQCLQNKAFATVYIFCKINVLLQCYSDVCSSEKRMNNISSCNLIYIYYVFKSIADIFLNVQFTKYWDRSFKNRLINKTCQKSRCYKNPIKYT